MADRVVQLAREVGARVGPLGARGQLGELVRCGTARAGAGERAVEPGEGVDDVRRETTRAQPPTTHTAVVRAELPATGLELTKALENGAATSATPAAATTTGTTNAITASGKRRTSHRLARHVVRERMSVVDLLHERAARARAAPPGPGSAAEQAVGEPAIEGREAAVQREDAEQQRHADPDDGQADPEGEADDEGEERDEADRQREQEVERGGIRAAAPERREGLRCEDGRAHPLVLPIEMSPEWVRATIVRLLEGSSIRSCTERSPELADAVTW